MDLSCWGLGPGWGTDYRRWQKTHYGSPSKSRGKNEEIESDQNGQCGVKFNGRWEKNLRAKRARFTKKSQYMVSQQVWNKLECNFLKFRNVCERSELHFQKCVVAQKNCSKNNVLLTVIKKCVLLSNFPYVVIYLVNWRKTAS